MNVVFMGTPHFAVPTLERLAGSHHEVRAVVTNPDRPKGRGRKVAAPPVKESALQLGLPVIQPPSAGDPDLHAQLATLSVDLFVVVAFSILPKALLEIPRIGSVNLHPSLLPAYRGAAPIVWAVANGETETGISTFLLNPRIDAGDILMQRRVAIGPDETAGELEARLCPLGADMVLETVNGLENDALQPLPQDSRGVTRAPKLSKKTVASTGTNRSRTSTTASAASTPFPVHSPPTKDSRSKFIARTPSTGQARPVRSSRPTHATASS